MLILGPNDVNDLITMDLAIEAVESAFTGLASGAVQNCQRQRLTIGPSSLNNMTASDNTLGYYGLKAFTNVMGYGQMMVLLFRIETGELEALISTPRLGATRTGAATGVATRWMSRPESRVLTIFGTGRQAATQVDGILAVRSIQEIRVVDLDPVRMQAFANRVAAAHAVKAIPVASAEEAVTGADIVVTVTTSDTPVIKGNWIDPGTHINAIGSNRPHARELDSQVLKRADRVATDSVAQAQVESGDLITAVGEGSLTWGAVSELSAIVGQQIAGRPSPESITVFKSLGIAAEDICMAGRILERARALDRGTDVVILPADLAPGLGQI